MSDMNKFKISTVEVTETKFIVTCELCDWQSIYLNEEWQAKNHFYHHLQWCKER